MGDVSKNFSYSEFERTSHADLAERNRIPSDEVRGNIKAIVNNVLQPLRDRIGKPLVISSGYRCKELNERVGGVATSMHLTGSASDVYTADETPYWLAKNVEDAALPYDQMILYPTFVHLSYKNGGTQRGQLLYNKSYDGRRL